MNSSGRNLWIGFAFLLHSVLAVLMAWAVAWISRGLTPLSAACVLLLSAAVSVAWYRLQRIEESRNQGAGPERESAWTPLEIALTIFLLFAAWRHFTWLLAPLPGPAGHAWQSLSKTNFGDLALHINYIRAFSEGLPAPFVNPIFASEILRYPIGPDLYNALWEAVGIPTSAHLFVIGMFCTWWAISFLRAVGGSFGILGFFLAGGALGWGVLAGQPLSDFQDRLEWKNTFLAVWITQRGFLWALPIGLLLWLRLKRTRLRRQLSQSEGVALGVLWGGLATFHLHAFVIVSLLLGGGAILDAVFEALEEKREGRGAFKELKGLGQGWTYPMLAALPLGAAAVFHSTHGFSKASVMSWEPGWTMPPELSWVQQLNWIWQNFGPSLFVVLLGFAIVMLSSKPTKAERRRFGIEMCFFVFMFWLFTAWKMAPWAWDNIKLLIWPWTLGFAAIGMGLRHAVRDRNEVLAWVLTFIAGGSGMISLGHSVFSPKDRSVLMWNTVDIAEAEAAVRDLPRDSVFAASTIHNHTLAWLGRNRAVGYEGHLWSHAIRHEQKSAELKSLFMGEDPVVQAQRLGATHIFWGPEEKMSWGNWASTWLSKFTLVRRVGNVEIYSLLEPRLENNSGDSPGKAPGKAPGKKIEGEQERALVRRSSHGRNKSSSQGPKRADRPAGN